MGARGREGIEQRALAALGTGFDLTCDFRLRYAKGAGAAADGDQQQRQKRRLVEVDEAFTRDVSIPGGSVIRGVPRDVGCDKGDRIRFRSDVLEFNQMSELLNQKSSIQGKVPSGYFNALFDLSGAWLEDAMDAKHLAFDGYFISLYDLHLTASPIILRDEVKKAVPSKWDPVALSRFIETYGTHIIVGMSIGGQDVVCVRQKHSSPISPADLKVHLEDLGDFLFSDGKSPSPLHRKTREGKNKVPDVFNRILQPNNLQLTSHSETSSKDGLTIICSKRGGGVYAGCHSEWLQRVSTDPDAILFKFVPITSLLTGIPGSGYLSHAINLYLRYKPAPEDLHYFLEFQVPLQWAPLFNELSLGPQRRKASFPILQLRFLGPKLHVSTAQVKTSQKPVTGLRLYLEGKKCNRLAVHVQHLSSLPSMLERLKANISTSSGTWQCQWRGSEDSGAAYLEPIHWKKYAQVCTSAVKYDPEWLQRVSGGVFVVTGVQLVTKGNWTKKSLHLRLLFTHYPSCIIQKTRWACAPVTPHKSSFLTNLSTTFTRETPPQKQEAVQMNSGVYPDGPPVPIQSRKLLRYIDMAEVVHGPHDVPGHWLVIAAKLVKEGGKVGLQVKFALLNYPSMIDKSF